MKIDFISFCKSLVFYAIALALGYSWINGEALVLKAKPPAIGYILVIAVVILLGSRLFYIIRNKYKKEANSTQ